MAASRYTIKQALEFGYTYLKNLDSFRLEAEILLAHLLTVSRTFLYTHEHSLLSPTDFQHYQQLCQRRLAGEPSAYLIGNKEFWSFDLEVNASTLIPRPETELLVQTTLDLLPQNKPLMVAELGTGSGAIAIALAIERPNWQIIAVDLSLAALEVAKKNCQRYHLNNMTLIHSNWYEQLPPAYFDAIISNPPYISTDDPHLSNLRFEPQQALASGPQGLDALTHIIRQSPFYFNKDGFLVVEHGYNQATAVSQLLHQTGFCQIQHHLDINAVQRVTSGHWKGTN